MSSADQVFMTEALALARRAGEAGEVPVGAVVVSNGEVIGRGWNQPIAMHDPTAHAEIVAMREAGQSLENYRLTGATLYVSLEPCPMCAGAMVHARINRLVFAAPDSRSGAAGSCFDIVRSGTLNHRVNVDTGIMTGESTALLQEFFRERR